MLHLPLTTVIDDRQRLAMISTVSMRLLYLIFQHLLGLLLLMAAPPAPRTSSSSCYGTRSPSYAAPTPDPA
jgi:hypothetical protein